MSVRTLLFSLLVAVIVGLVGAQWWLSKQQNEHLAKALSTTAFTVSRDTVSIILFEQNEDSDYLQEQPFEMRLESNAAEGSIIVRSPQFERRIIIPKSSMQKTLNNSKTRQIWVAMIISVLGVIFALLIANRFAKPLKRLEVASQRVASGEFGTEMTLPRFAPNELKQTITAFNQMSHALQQLEQDNKALRAREQADELSDLARGLAHTLRNPLNTLGLSIDELMREDIDQNAKQQFALLSRRQINVIDKRLRALLDASVNDDSNQAISLRDIVNEIVAEFPQHLFVRNTVEDAHLLGSAREINMILHTLISNAVEASAPEQAIHIEVTKHAKSVIVTIKDHGTGITPTVAKRLFQPHVSSKPHGAGLGLYLAKRVVSGRYNGNIELFDNVPHGTCSVLTLQDRRL